MSFFSKIYKKSKLLLVIGSEGAILINTRNNVLINRCFAKSVNDLNLKNYIIEHNKYPIYIVFNNAEQFYTIKNIPNSIFNIKSLIQMKIKKDLQEYQIKSAFLLDKKKNEYIFAATKLNSILNSWIEFIIKYSNAFRGIMLLPLELTKIIGKLTESSNNKGINWNIFVAYTKTGGVRYLALKNNKMILTRLTGCIIDASPDIIAGNIYQEIQNTTQSLIRFGLDINSAVNLYLVVPQDIKASMLTIKFQKGFVSNIFTPYEFSKILKLDFKVHKDQFCDSILLCAIIQNGDFSVFHTKNTKLLCFLSKMSSYFLPISAILTVCISIINTIYIIRIRLYNEEYLALTEKKGKLEYHLKDLYANRDVVTLYQMHDIIGIYKLLSTINYSPVDYVRNINKMRLTDIKVRSFSWKMNEDNDKVVIAIKFVIKSDHNLFNNYKYLQQNIYGAFTDHKVTISYLPSHLNASEVPVDVYMEK